MYLVCLFKCTYLFSNHETWSNLILGVDHHLGGFFLYFCPVSCSYSFQLTSRMSLCCFALSVFIVPALNLDDHWWEFGYCFPGYEKWYSQLLCCCLGPPWIRVCNGHFYLTRQFLCLQVYFLSLMFANCESSNVSMWFYILIPWLHNVLS